MQTEPHQLGRSGEGLAADYLRKHGYQLIELNARNHLGEIDIVARDGQTLVFVEVKTRLSPEYGNPKHAITRQKQNRLTRVALAYLKKAGQLHSRARFDVVSIDWTQGTPQIELIQNAFEATRR